MINQKENNHIRDSKTITIAVDGFSSCGKSTFAKLIAQQLSYIYIDSGAMYRAVALAYLRAGGANSDGVDLDLVSRILSGIDIQFAPNNDRDGWITTLNGEVVEDSIRSLEVSGVVSRIAAIAEVRHAMVAQQQRMGKAKGIVMDGRDIGTVVFPNAELKIFMTADPLIRAERRLKELKGKGIEATIDEVLENIEERDRIDQTREESPLRKANDAVVLDNSSMTIPEQLEWFDTIIKERF